MSKQEQNFAGEPSRFPPSELWEAMVNNQHYHILVVDRQGTFLYLNFPTPGLTVDELVGKRKVTEFVPQEQVGIVENALEKVFSGQDSAHKYELYTPQWDTWFSNVMMPIHDGDEIKAAIAISFDVTKEKKAESAARESESKWRSITEYSPDYIFLLDLDYNLQFINQTIPPLKKEDVIGMSMFNFVDKRFHKTIKETLDFVKETGKTGSYEVVYDDPVEGKKTYFESKVGPVIDDGKITGLTINARDVTQQKNLQAQVLQSERLASIGQLAAGVGHEINNPLMIIYGYLEVLEEAAKSGGLTNELFEEYSQKKKQSLDRIANIVKGLRTYASMKDKDEALDAHELISETSKLVTEIYKNDGVELHCDLKAEKHTIMGNGGKLQQVVMNLLTNSKDALAEVPSPTINIVTSNVDDHLNIEIIDNGHGIPESDLGKIFDTFYTTKEVGRGMGLGLGIVESIVAEMKGAVAASSTPGAGAHFTVTIPLSNKLVSKSNEEVVTKSVAEARALVVDDERDIRQLMGIHLKRLGLSVDEASNGQQALELHVKNKYDIVFTDLKMGQMSGEEFLEQARKLSNHGETKFVVITGAVNKDLRLLADQVLLKPFKFQDIQKVVSTLLEK